MLTFDGPGQPAAIHGSGLVFRPDWENVVGPVLDYAITRPEVDPARIALLGLSLGGALAPRAAAYEPRIAAVIAVDGVYDVRRSHRRHVRIAFQPGRTGQQGERRNRSRTRRHLRGGPEAKPDHPVGTGPRPVCDGRQQRSRFRGELPGLSRTRNGIAERITCPVLVCDAADDLFFSGDGKTKPEPQQLFDHLTGPKTMLRFTAEEGADAHCHVGAQRLATGRIYDWLDATL
ncbi:alpha/beta fold hydrolase [Fodinicola feengrottensis]|uniref:alpha/beta fold hydrolase n=1 Tax=Fodinicola feengrottensis TaxID=435914 RepID=UPI0024429929|nr:alpha/beta fold hydrolase [Fodinicola feengrottensis]